MTEVNESFAEVLNAADKCQKIIQDIKNCEKDSLSELAGKMIVLDLFFSYQRFSDALQQWADCGFPVKETDTGIFELVKED